MSGTSRNVIQARDVSGGVQIFGTGPEHILPVPRQVPADVRGFVNRYEDVLKLDALLAERKPEAPAICVITGTAGVGKTSLAIHWAHSTANRFPAGQLYINLRGYDPSTPIEPLYALEHFLTALRIPGSAIPSDLESRAALFRSLVAEKEILILLDNAATVAQIRPLLPGAGPAVVVVTSRNRLSGLSGRDQALRLNLEVFTDNEAVQLLTSTTSIYRAGDRDAELAELARLCARLPLALRIAAERAASRPTMPLADLIQDLRDESSLWDALSSEDPDESEAVRPVFAWSYRSLPEDAAVMFRRLGLHPAAEFSLGAAAALAGVPVRRARQLLDTLVGVHLVEQVAADRFQFHDLLRAFATDEVMTAESPQSRHEALERELHWYLHSTANAVAAVQDFFAPVVTDAPPLGCEPRAFAGSDDAVAWYTAEKQTLVAITRVAAEAAFDRIAWQLAVTLYPMHHNLRSPYADWLAMADIGLRAAVRENEVRAQAALLTSIAVAESTANHERSEDYLNRALSLWRELGDLEGQTRTTTSLGWVSVAKRDFGEAARTFEAAAALARQLPNDRWHGATLLNLSVVQAELGHLSEAIDLAEQALTLQSGEARTMFDNLLWLVQYHRKAGNFALAEQHLNAAEQATEHLDSVNNRLLIALQQGLLELARNEPEAALATFQGVAAGALGQGDRRAEAQAFSGAGHAYGLTGRHTEAVQFHLRAAANFEALNDPWQQAISLADAFAAQGRSGDIEHTGTLRERILNLIEPFNDPAAETLRADIGR